MYSIGKNENISVRYIIKIINIKQQEEEQNFLQKTKKLFHFPSITLTQTYT